MKYSALLLTLSLAVLTLGCIEELSSLTGGKDDNFVCTSPYMQVGNRCCLDVNQNGICDADDKTVETTQATSTTIAGPQQINCKSDAECDTQKMSIICDGENVMKVTTDYTCSNPGTIESKCISSTSKDRIDQCIGEETCYRGVCVKLSDLTGVSTIPESTLAPTTTLAEDDSETTTTLEEPVVETTTTTLGEADDDVTTTTVESPTPDDEVPITTTTLLTIPCGSFKAYFNMQCAVGGCSAGKICTFVPPAMIGKPGTCTCKAKTTTTTTTFHVITLPHLTSTTLHSIPTIPTIPTIPGMITTTPIASIPGVTIPTIRTPVVTLPNTVPTIKVPVTIPTIPGF